MFQGSFKSYYEKVSRKFLGCVERISRGIQESFQDVSGVFLGWLKEVPKEFQQSFKGVSKGFQESSWVFHGNLKSVSRIFQRSFKEVLWKFQRYLKEVLRCKESFMGENKTNKSIGSLWVIHCCILTRL